MTKSYLATDLTPVQMQAYLQSSVGPRPIAFASTINQGGLPNLSPFSFFNVFSANPPILVFSPARRVRNNTTKHTLQNCLTTREVVINVVNYDIVQQMSLSSTEYPDGVNEFEKSGLTMLKSDVVKPFRVKESPVQFECKVNDVVELGDQGGAGNLVICEVLKIHISEDVLDDKGGINQHKIDLVSRMGGNWYSRSNQGLFEIPKPLSTLGLGVDNIPENIKNNPVFSGNDFGLLGNIEKFPTKEEIDIFVSQNSNIQKIILTKDTQECFLLAKKYLKNQDVESAWKVLLAINN